MSNDLIVLDFDGVICDSRPECMVTSYNAYNSMFRLQEPRCNATECVPGEWRAIFDDYRFLVRIAEEYLLLWKLIFGGGFIDADASIRDQAFATQLEMKSFKEAFFSSRRLWQAENLSGWLDCNPLFAGMASRLRRWTQEKRLVVLSAKDTRSIRTILSHHGIELPSHRVLGNEAGDKHEAMQRLQTGAPGRSIRFVDDHPENLRLMQGLGIRCYWARWGYLDPRALAETAENSPWTQIRLDDLDAF